MAGSPGAANVGVVGRSLARRWADGFGRPNCPRSGQPSTPRDADPASVVGAHRCDRFRSLDRSKDDRRGVDVGSNRSSASTLGVPARFSILSAMLGGARRAMAVVVVVAVGVRVPQPRVSAGVRLPGVWTESTGTSTPSRTDSEPRRVHARRTIWGPEARALPSASRLCARRPSRPGPSGSRRPA